MLIISATYTRGLPGPLAPGPAGGTSAGGFFADDDDDDDEDDDDDDDDGTPRPKPSSWLSQSPTLSA